MDKHLLFPAGLLLLACTAGYPAGVAPTAVRKAEHFQLPAIKRDCTTCHTSRDMTAGSPLLVKPLAELCIGCHPERMAPNEHAVNIVPALKVEKLPLQNNKMTCITCHDPHANTYGVLLRVPARQLCPLCHQK